MRTYDGPRSLEKFGVKLLTGEACGLAMRGLFDLTENGKALMQEFLRVECNSEAWNRGSDDDPHVASVMLPYSVCKDLFIFAHVRAGTPNVFVGGHVHVGQWTETKYEYLDETLKHPDKTWEPQVWAVDDEYMERVNQMVERGFFYISRTYAKSSHPGTGLDNTHAMSGRTV